MKTALEWKALLQARIRVALRARDALVLGVLRETLAAIENAEAPAASVAPASDDGVFAGSVAGVGACDVPRLRSTPEAVVVLLERELGERRAAAAAYGKLDRLEEARALSSQADMLASLLEGESSG